LYSTPCTPLPTCGCRHSRRTRTWSSRSRVEDAKALYWVIRMDGPRGATPLERIGETPALRAREGKRHEEDPGRAPPRPLHHIHRAALRRLCRVVIPRRAGGFCKRGLVREKSQGASSDAQEEATMTGNCHAKQPVGFKLPPLWRRSAPPPGGGRIGTGRGRVPALRALALTIGAYGSARAGNPQRQLTWGVHITLAPTWFDPAETPGIITPY